MNATAKETPDRQCGFVRHGGQVYAGLPGETVLDTLLRHNIDVAYSCKKGTCLSCLMRTDDEVAERARDGLRTTLVDQGYFLPCVCPADADIEVYTAADEQLYSAATATGRTSLAPHITGLTLQPAERLDYRAGQFVNIRRSDGLTRSYSIASIPDDGNQIELHVKMLPHGEMSTWVADALRVGDKLEIQGPNGDCFYLSDSLVQPLLLIGNGAGLAPLIAIAREALGSKHTGPIHLYHGSRHADGLYLQEQLTKLASDHQNFHYAPCISGADAPAGYEAGRAEDVAFKDHEQLAGWKVYLCGYPPMVHGARKRAYLMGAAMHDILCDAFELRDLRQSSRD